MINKGKTIKQIANEIGVSKQAVYKRYKGKLYNGVYPYTHTDKGVLYILEQGETIIKSDFLNNDAPTGVCEDHIRSAPINTIGAYTEYIPNNITIKTLEALNSTVELLKTQLDVKDKQLEKKDEQVIRLQIELEKERVHSREQADKLAVFIDQSQKLQLAQLNTTQNIKEVKDESNIELVNNQINNKDNKKQSFISKIFGQKKN